MISRTKANYGFKDLILAALTSERENRYHRNLLKNIEKLFPDHYAALTSSGRGGLYHLLRSLDVDNVLIPAYTCNAVVEAAKLAEKKIVFVDVEDDGFNMLPEMAARKADERTVVIATHQFGIPCRVDEMVDLCHEKGVFVIEDCAACLGGSYKGKALGSFGDAAFFSFDSTKLVTVPLKAGFVVVRDESIFRKFEESFQENSSPMPIHRKAKYLAMSAILVAIENPLLYKLFHWMLFDLPGRHTAETNALLEEPGPFYSDRVASWQARIASSQLEELGKIAKARSDLYIKYRECLKGATTFRVPPGIDNENSAPIRFPIRVRKDKMEFYRRALLKGVDMGFSFTHIVCPENFVNAHALANSILDIPFYYKLSEQEFEDVVSTLLDLDRRGS